MGIIGKRFLEEGSYWSLPDLLNASALVLCEEPEDSESDDRTF